MKQFEKLESFCRENNLIINDSILSKYQKFYEYLVEQNKVMNLTAITDIQDVEVKHFIDSLESAQIINDIAKEKNNKEKSGGISDSQNSLSQLSVIDIGTGAGFPGIPLAIEFPEHKFVLADSLNKRINFINNVLDICNLRNVAAVHGRAEDLAINSENREKYDICVSRAVANMPVLLEYCLPFVNIGGYVIMYKSGDYKEELDASKNALKILGGKLTGTKEFMLPNTDYSRSLIIVKKEKQTPKKYPRKAGTPKKEPL